MEMWSKCLICLRDFVDEGQDKSIEYRKKILETGTVHLFDELVEWSNVDVHDPLPFCPSCLEEIENISSLSNSNARIKTKIDTTVTKLMMEALRSRKVVKANGDLVTNPSADVKVRVKTENGGKVNSNCVVCYSLYSEGQSAPEFSTRNQKKNILKSCQVHLNETLRKNQCGFDWETLPERIFHPFCQKCFAAILRIGNLSSRMETTGDNLFTKINTFTVESLRLKSCNFKRSFPVFVEPNARGEDSSDLEADDTTHSTEVIDFSQSDDDGDDVVMYDPLVMDSDPIDPNQHSATQRQTRINVNMDTFIRPQATSSSVTVPLAQPSRCSSRHDSPMQHEAPSCYDFSDSENHMDAEGDGTGRIVDELLESMPSPEQSSGSRRSLSLSLKKKTQESGDKDVFSCPNCKKIYIYEGHLTNHMMTCISSAATAMYDGMPHLIDYSNYPDLQISENSESIRYICTVEGCAKSFGTEGRLNQHVSLHTAPKPYKCKHCGEGFAQKNFLRNHKRNKNTCKKKPRSTTASSGKPKRTFNFQCTFCPSQADRAQDLSHHYQSHYDIALETRCTMCKFVYSNKYQLIRHFKKKHGIFPDGQNNEIGGDETMPFPQPQQGRNSSEQVWYINRA